MSSYEVPRSDSAATPDSPLSPRAAYNILAKHYDAWYWQEFWHRNEAPLVGEAFRRVSGRQRLLDIGTGTGFYAARATESGWDSVGMDISENMLDVAREHYGSRIQLVHADVGSLPFHRAVFDVAIAARVLTHVRDVKSALAEAARVLSVGGRLVVTDVDAAHDYRATRMQIGDSMIYVDTYKHTAPEIITAAHAVGLVFKRGRRLTAQNVAWLPDTEEFKSIDRSGSRPIAYVLTFRRALQTRTFSTRS